MTCFTTKQLTLDARRRHQLPHSSSIAVINARIPFDALVLDLVADLTDELANAPDLAFVAAFRPTVAYCRRARAIWDNVNYILNT